MRTFVVSCGMLACAATVAAAGTLEVGPGKTYAKPSQAIAAAKDGDVIEIDAAGAYEGDVAYVHASNLTIRGVGQGRALLDARGKVAGRKGIFVTKGRNITVENIEFRNAGGEVNAAGIRAEGQNLTVRNCRFHECRDAILGGAGEVLIEHSEFSHCGHNANPATHNLYMSGRVTRLTYRFNYSHHTYEGHLLKSRARENWILFNRLTDEEGTGSAVIDLPNGGLAVIVGNVLHKGPKGQNNRLIAYGMEGIRHERNEVYVVNNTMWWDNRREAWFVRVENRGPRLPAGAPATQPVTREVKTVIRNNVCIGPVPLTNAAVFEEAGNLRFKTMGEAVGFVNPAAYDFRLKAGSPCIDRGVDPGVLGEVSLRPEFQYVHPCDRMKRPDDGKIDIGAFEYVPVDEGEGAVGAHPRGVDPATRHGTGHGRRALGAA